jgi:hypothetical protein
MSSGFYQYTDRISIGNCIMHQKTRSLRKSDRKYTLFKLQGKDKTRTRLLPRIASSRRTPYDADLVRADLIRQPMAYSGTGIKLLRTPHELQDADKPYWEYGLSFTPIEDPHYGDRVATRMSQAVAPPKWDVNRLHQVYPRWKEEGLYLGDNRDRYDRTNTLRII